MRTRQQRRWLRIEWEGVGRVAWMVVREPGTPLGRDLAIIASIGEMANVFRLNPGTGAIWQRWPLEREEQVRVRPPISFARPPVGARA